MKIPKEVVVGPFVYRIHFVEGGLKSDTGHPLYGETRHYEKEIVIDDRPDSTSKEETFIHEVIHCLDAVYKFSDKELPESAIERLGTSLYAFIKDNPEVFK